MKLGNFLRSSSVKNHFKHSRPDPPNIIIQIPSCQAINHPHLIYPQSADKENSQEPTEVQYLNIPSGDNTGETRVGAPKHA